jgi:hypothetical protein
VEGTPSQYTIKCQSVNGQVYRIKESEFLRKARANPDTWNLICYSMCKNKANIKNRMKKAEGTRNMMRNINFDNTQYISI